jgi:hypothetical protein
MCVKQMWTDCRDYLADSEWMERSGNMCWGMGAANSVPCVNCGVELRYHWIPFDDEDNEF